MKPEPERPTATRRPDTHAGKPDVFDAILYNWLKVKHGQGYNRERILAALKHQLEVWGKGASGA
jgi:hypothetical protein